MKILKSCQRNERELGTSTTGGGKYYHSIQEICSSHKKKTTLFSGWQLC